MRFRNVSSLFSVIILVACTSTPKDNEIWYYTEDSLPLEINIENWETPIVSHKIVKDKGVIKFEEPITSVANGAFAGCNRLTKILLPKSVTHIGDYSFSACSKLNECPLTASILNIGTRAFSGCCSLGGIITIPDNVVYIGVGCFEGCKMIDEFQGKFVSADGRCLVFNHNLIAFCDKLCNEEPLLFLATPYTIPEGVTSINGSVFAYSEIHEVILPNSIRIIGDSAFYHCVNLESINIPESIDSIGRDAFTHCKNLRSILVEGSHTYIESLIGHQYYDGPSVNYRFPDFYRSEYEWIVGKWVVNLIDQGEFCLSFNGTGEKGTVCKTTKENVLEGTYALSKEEDLLRIYLQEASSYDIIEIHPENKLYWGKGFYLVKQ